MWGTIQDSRKRFKEPAALWNISKKEKTVVIVRFPNYACKAEYSLRRSIQSERHS